MNKETITFICFPMTENLPHILFKFHVDGKWDEDKLTIKKAIERYPLYKYNWISEDDTTIIIDDWEV